MLKGGQFTYVKIGTNVASVTNVKMLPYSYKISF
ncbi:hypothetical protein CKALI_04160 [Corynebacterium kalinowskii]|uniref:Uncharacterized protein n=1 Tax=Corynebacterium kalinowskii TaxID=2675216 RepID=A0A6B8VPG8_9CORY|nr:hypothetical protein CKALI_04160 [Corynebacterium kalinowskii]